MGVGKKRRLKPVLLTAAVLAIVAAFTAAPGILISLGDMGEARRLVPLEFAETAPWDKALAQTLAISNSLDNAPIGTTGRKIENYEERDYYCFSVLCEEIKKMEEAHLLPLALTEWAERSLHATNDSLEITVDGEGDDIVVFAIAEDDNSVGMLYDGAGAVRISFYLSSAAVEDTDLKTLLKRYISWLELDELPGWELTGGASGKMKAFTKNAPFELSVTEYRAEASYSLLFEAYKPPS